MGCVLKFSELFQALYEDFRGHPKVSKVCMRTFEVIASEASDDHLSNSAQGVTWD